VWLIFDRQSFDFAAVATIVTGYMTLFISGLSTEET
jgi:hypothetical protein